jgi:hypothetical protein
MIISDTLFLLSLNVLLCTISCVACFLEDTPPYWIRLEHTDRTHELDLGTLYVHIIHSS